jgi:iron complex transport system substrate-binding protein
MVRTRKRYTGFGGLFLCLIMLAFLCPAAPCSAATYPMTVVDDYGRTVTIDAEPQNIVSLAPSNTEILFALGLGDKVVGVTPFCDYPPEAASKTSVGGPSGSTVNTETIITLNPDLILAADINGEDIVNTLEGLGFVVYAINSTDIADILNDTNNVGYITNAEAAAATLTGEMQDKIDAITSETGSLTEEEKTETMHICWYDPIYVAGGGTYINDVIEKASGINIYDDLTGWNMVDIESVIARNPETVIVTAMGGTSSSTWEWVNTETRIEGVSARVNGRVYYAEANWIERAGPRIIDGLELVAEYLHPEIFFDPWAYDLNSDSAISKAEAIGAVQAYFNGLMAKAQAIQVVMLYFG